jgi:glutamate 5-kinase
MQTPKTLVVKVGTSTLTRGTGRLSKKHMMEIAQQLAHLHENGNKIVLVTSGAVFAGREVLHESKIERSLPAKQMLSSVGQVRLMQIWTELFGIFGIMVGQLLLTRGDFANRQRYLNVRNTLQALLQHHIIPIINENDSVSIQELRLGDNDNLSALVANLIAADRLILLTDQEGLFTADPAFDPKATMIKDVHSIDDAIFELAGGTKKALGFGTGGMYTKVEAAHLASKSGIPTVIASSKVPKVIIDIAEGKSIGTFFHSETTSKESRKRWLLSEKPQGKILVDAGAEQKLLKEGASLLAVGIKSADSAPPFERGAIVQILSTKGSSIAVGISNYSMQDIQKIQGKQSKEIVDLLGYSYGPEVIHRDNMAVIISKGGGK